MKVSGKAKTPITAAQSQGNRGEASKTSTRKTGGTKARASQQTSRKKNNGVKTAVLERISDGILAFDAGMNYTYLNEQAGNLLGCSATDLVGKNLREAHPEVDHTPFMEACQRALETQSVVWLNEYFPLTNRWLEGRVYPSQDGVSVLFNEGTSKHEQERDRMLAMFPRQNPAPVMRLSRQAEILYANRAAASLVETWNRADESPASFLKIQELLPQILQNTNREIEIEHEGRVFSCELVPFREEGYVNLYFRDITQRKQAEEALRAIVNQSGAGISRSDLLGNFTFVNQAFCDMLDYSESELTRMSIWDVTDETFQEKNRRLFERLVATGEGYQLEKRLVRRNGSLIWVSVSTSVLLDAEGRVLGSTAVIVDVTRRKRAEESLLDNARRSLFLSSLSDMIRSIEVPARIQVEAVCLLGAHLKASRLAYVQVEPDGRFLVHDNYVDGVPEMTGWFSAADFIPQDQLSKFQAGRCLTVSDVQNDPRFSDAQKASLEALFIRSQLILPFTRGKKVMAALLVQQSQPRVWKDEELSLLEESAERMQIAIERAQAEGRLRDSERRFRILANTVPSIVWTSSPDGQLLYVNDRWYEFTGLPRRQELPQWSDLGIHPEDASNFFREIRTIENGQSEAVVEVRVRRQDGAYRWLQNRSVPTLDENGQVTAWHGVLTDIHDRVEKDAELRKIIDSTPFMLTRCSRDLRYLFVSRAYAEMIGRTPEEVTGRPIVEIMGEEGLQTILPYVERVLQGEHVDYESRVSFEKISAPYLHVAYTPDRDDHGNVIGWFASIVDITERKQMEESLRESEQKFNILFNKLPFTALVLRPKDGVIIDVNEEFEAVFGYSRQEAIGKTPLALGLDSQPEDRASILAELQTSVSIRDMELILLTKPRGPRTFLINSDRVNIGGSEYILQTAQDITERKQIEEALRESERKFSLIYDNLPFVAALARAEDTVLVDVNETFEKVFGYRKEQAIGKTSLQLGINPDEQGRARLRSELEKHGAAHNVELELFTRSGTKLTFLANIDHVMINGERYILSTMQDVTASKRLEQSLARERELLNRIFESIPVMLTVYEPSTKLLRLNSYFEKLIGWSSEEAAGISLMESCYPDPDYRAEVAAFMQRMTDGEWKDIRMQTRDGHTLETSWSNIRLSNDMQVGIGIDITPRKQREEELRARTEEIETLMEVSPIGIFVAHDPGCTRITANPAGYHLVELPEDSSANISKSAPDHERPIYRVFRNGGELKADELPMQTAARLGMEIEEETLELRFDNGVQKYIYAYAKPLFDGIGNVRGAIAAMLDITERRHAEEKLRASEERLRQSEERLKLIFETVQGVITLFDGDGRLYMINSAGEKQMGRPREELIGKTMLDLYPRDFAEQRIQEYRRMIEDGGMHSYEAAVPQGAETRWYKVLANTMYDGSLSRKVIVTNAVDITDRKRVEEDLKAARERAEGIASRMARLQRVTAALSETSTPSQIARILVEQGAPALGAATSSLMVLSEDHETLEIVFSSTPQNLTRSYLRFPISLNVPAADAARTGQPVWLQSRQEYLERYPHLADQIEQWGYQAALALPMIYQGNVFGVLTLSFDRILANTFEDREYVLTLARQGAQALERAKAENALRSSERRYRAIVSQATAGIVRKDPAGRLLFVNQAFCDMLGMTEAELAGRQIWELTHEEDVPENKRLYDRLMAEGTPFQFEKRMIRKDGSILWASVSVSPVMDDTGKTNSAVSVYVDVTRRMQAESRLALLSIVSELTREYDEPDEFFFAVSRVIGEHFQVRRSLFNEIDLDNDREIVHHDYCRGVDSVAGVHAISDYSSITSAEMMAGKTVVNCDSKLDPRTAADYERSYVKNGERAYVAVPLLREDRWVASLWISDDKPREWDKEDVSLLKAIAERTWTAAEKLRIDRALRESEERLRVTFNTTVVGFATLSPDTKFMDVNDAYCNIVGYPRQELLEMNYNRLIHPRFSEETGRQLAQLIGGSIPSFTIEKIFIRRDGTEIWVQNSLSIVRDSGGAPLHLIAICQDVTERKRAEEELHRLNLELEERVKRRTVELQRANESLRESEATSQLILESIPDAIVITDREGRIVHANQQLAFLFGYTPNEVLGQPVELLLPERFHNRHIQNRETYARHPTRRIMGLGLDLFGLRKDGSEFPVDVMLSPISNNTTWDVMVAIRDNTKQRQVQEALRNNEEKLRTLFEILPVGISFLNKDGKISELNNALTEILDLSKIELLTGKHATRRYIRADGTPMLPSEFASTRARREQKTIYNVETGVVKENGEVIWTSVNAAPVQVADVEAAIVTIDITERKQAEEALHRHRERLKLLSRRLVEVQEEERHAIAQELHDRVGQNLAALTLNLNILRNQLSREVLEKVGTRLNDSVTLVKDILTITRSVMADLRPDVLDDYGLDAAINEYTERFTQRYGIRVITHTPAKSTPRLERGIEMTLLRIAQEALKNVARHAQATQAVVSVEMESDAILMTIEDNGLGILSWQKVNQPGSHGLRIMRERAEAFGGYLKVHSTYKNGTKIEVKIPLGSSGTNATKERKS